MGRSDRPREFRDDDDGRGLEGGLASIVSKAVLVYLKSRLRVGDGSVAKVRE